MRILDNLGLTKEEILEELEGKEITAENIARIITKNNGKILQDINKNVNDFAEALRRTPI